MALSMMYKAEHPAPSHKKSSKTSLRNHGFGNPTAQNVQPTSSVTRNGETEFNKVHLNIVGDTPLDLKKTEIAKNLV
jgi:hypothetical protein